VKKCKLFPVPSTVQLVHSSGFPKCPTWRQALPLAAPMAVYTYINVSSYLYVTITMNLSTNLTFIISLTTSTLHKNLSTTVQFWISSSTHNLAGLPASVVDFRKCLSYGPQMAVSSMEPLASFNVLMVYLDFRLAETYSSIAYIL
jgi:hypothetical protein